MYRLECLTHNILNCASYITLTSIVHQKSVISLDILETYPKHIFIPQRKEKPNIICHWWWFIKGNNIVQYKLTSQGCLRSSNVLPKKTMIKERWFMNITQISYSEVLKQAILLLQAFNIPVIESQTKQEKWFLRSLKKYKKTCMKRSVATNYLL